MAFVPSHAVPDTGLRAWAAPDPAREPVATLGPGQAVEVVERRGRWARVGVSSGWTGWVDGDLLVAHAAPAPAPPPPGPAPSGPASAGPEVSGSTTASPAPPGGDARRWGVGSSLLLVFSTVVDWDRPIDFDFGGQNFSGWDLPLVFLFDYELSSTKGASIGLFLFVVAAVAVAAAHSPRAGPIWRAAGGVTLLVGALYAVQAQRLMSDFGDGWALDYLGPGFFLALVAGVGLVLAPARPRASGDQDRAPGATG